MMTQRLAASLFLVIGVCLSLQAFAHVHDGQVESYDTQPMDPGDGPFTSLGAAQAYLQTYYNGSPPRQQAGTAPCTDLTSLGVDYGEFIGPERHGQYNQIKHRISGGWCGGGHTVYVYRYKCDAGYVLSANRTNCIAPPSPPPNPCPPTGPSIGGGEVAYEGRGSVSGDQGALCFGGCEVSFREQTQMGLCITINSQNNKKGCTLETVSRLDRTGAACTGGGSVERNFLPTINVIATEGGDSFSVSPTPPTNCVTGSGRTICVETDTDKDCGTVNGQEICVPKPQRNNPNSTKPDQVCVDVEGKAHCMSRGSSPTTSSPPAPGGAPAAQITAARPGEGGNIGTATGTTVNVYNGSSAGSSSSSGGSGSGSSSGGSGSGGSSGSSGAGSGGSGSGGTSGGPDPEEGGTCGGTGQPVCRVRIDETGVPSTPGAISTEGRDAALDGIGTMAATKLNEPTPIEGTAFENIRRLLPTFSTGQCQSFTSGAIWAGKSFTFPGVKGCEAFEKLKVWEGYFLILYTIYACMLRAISGSKPKD